jgi:hypothetical protein
MNVRVLPVVLLLATGATTCGGDSSTPSSPSTTPTSQVTSPSVSNLPQPGVWTARAGFGTFDMTVNGDSTAITKIAFHFESWRCGNVTHSGGVTVTPSSGWPITNRQFSLDSYFSGNLSDSMAIRGSFASSTSASGSWSAKSGGTTCSGTWTSAK